MIYSIGDDNSVLGFLQAVNLENRILHTNIYRLVVRSLLEYRTQTAIWEMSGIWAAVIRVCSVVVTDFEVCDIFINIIIIIIIIIIISFMHGIYTYIPETNYVPREHSVAAILLLLFMVLISLVSVLNLLYFYISTFRSMCAVRNMAVFCSSLTSCFPGMLITYFLNDFEIVPVAPIITGITSVFTFHMRCIYIVRSLCFRLLF